MHPTILGAGWFVEGLCGCGGIILKIASKSMFHGYGMGTAKGAMHMAWTQIFYIKREALDMIRYDTLPIINYPGIIALNQFMLKRNNSKQISK